MTNLGIALGGGGARGLAHIGILKVLDREKIPIHSITGCSMGAVVGGLYAYFGNALEVERFVDDALKDHKFAHLNLDNLSEDQNDKKDEGFINKFTDFVQDRIAALRAIREVSVIDQEETDRIFSLIPNPKIKSLKLKFSAIATDLLTGEEINFTEGNLREVLRASSAIPGIFPPVKIDGQLLVDGSASESVPVSKVKEFCSDRILAIDVTRNMDSPGALNNAIEIVFRTQDISSHHLSKERLKEADLVISPKVKQYLWSDFKFAKRIIKLGEEEAEKRLPEINKLMNRNYYVLEFEHFLKKFKS